MTWLWILGGIWIACFVLNWFLVMGADPRKWKAAKRVYEYKVKERDAQLWKK